VRIPRRPDRDEDGVGREPHALDDRPEISAAVMMQNVPWNAMNNACGMVPFGFEADAFQQRVREITEPGVAGGEGERVAKQRPRRPTTPSEMKLIIIVLREFFDRASPP
jgi:hypothetical protein